MLRSTLHRVVDAALEASVLGSFTRIGPAVRSRTGDWQTVGPVLRPTRAVVTGSSSGIGRAVATGLAERGVDVVVTSRSAERADTVAREIAAEIQIAGHPPAELTGLALDTAEPESIVEFTNSLLSGPPIDVVVHNAGALTDEYRSSGFGIEATLASHLVGPHLLTDRLREQLAPGARVLFMSSGGMYTQQLDVAELEMTPADYRGAIAYARAKRGQVELVAHLGPQLAPDVIMHAMHPGWVDTDGVAQGLPGFGKVMGPLLRAPDDGADTMIWLALADLGGASPGSFFLDRAPRRRAYVPGTSTDPIERQRLMAWLDDIIAPHRADLITPTSR